MAALAAAIIGVVFASVALSQHQSKTTTSSIQQQNITNITLGVNTTKPLLNTTINGNFIQIYCSAFPSAPSKNEFLVLINASKNGDICSSFALRFINYSKFLKKYNITLNFNLTTLINKTIKNFSNTCNSTSKFCMISNMAQLFIHDFVHLPNPAHRIGIIHGVNSFSNWAGYAVASSFPTNGSIPKSNITKLNGTWIVQTASFSNEITTSTQWIGIGGYFAAFGNSTDKNNLIQTGTASYYINGVANYTAWYELLPISKYGYSIPINSMIIQPGNKIYGSIKLIKKINNTTQQWNITINDTSRKNDTFTKILNYTSDEASGEWIEERPSTSIFSELSNFGTAYYGPSNTGIFGSDYATVGSTTDPIGLLPHQNFSMVDSNNHFIALTGPLSDGSSFNVYKVANVSNISTISLTPSNTILDSGQVETFKIVLNYSGFGPFNIELYNISGSKQQDSNVTIQYPGGSNTISFVANSTTNSTFTFNAIATDTGASPAYVFNSISNTIKVFPQLKVRLIVSNQTIFNRQGVKLTALVSGGTGNFSYGWSQHINNANYFINTTTTNSIIVYPNATSNYSVIVTDKGTTTPDSSTSSNTITVYPDQAIKISNNQSAATSSPFQQMLVVNSSKYKEYEAGNLDNVEFFYPNGTIIPSWLESGNSNSSNNTIYWLRINGGIGAKSSIDVYIGFASMSVNLFNVQTTGEAPQLSPTYAEYDDGSNVFNYYWNFAGTSIPSGVTLSSSNSTEGNFTVNNGLHGNVDGWNRIRASFTIPSTPFVLDGFLSAIGNGRKGWYSNYFMSSIYANATTVCENGAGAGNCVNSEGYWSGIDTTSPTTPTNAVFVFDVTDSTSTLPYWYSNNGTLEAQSGNPSNVGFQSLNAPIESLGFSAGSGYIANGTIQWIRIRAYPPNGIMPSALDPSDPSSKSIRSLIVIQPKHPCIPITVNETNGTQIHKLGCTPNAANNITINSSTPISPSTTISTVTSSATTIMQ